MIIESLDALETWLIRELEPICEAEPAALAKYVIALAKKEKPEGDLKALCEDQLDVFLGEETKPFVGNLFEALISKSYLPPAPPASVEEPPVEKEQKGIKRKSFEEYPNKDEADKLLRTENRVDVSKAKVPDDKENIDNIEKNNDDTTKNENDITDTNNKLPIPDRLDDVRMRSVSKDRSVKSMSPRPSRHRTRRSSRSPPSHRSSRHSRHTSSRNTRDKPRESTRNRDNRRPKGRREPTRERCRDYEEKGYCILGETCRFDHGRDPVEVDDRNLPLFSQFTTSYPTPQPNVSTTLPNPTLQVFPNVLPQRPIMPNHPANINTSLTTVQVQKTRPSTMEANPSQVPIFRPRNPIAFMRNISPTGIQGIGSTPVVTLPIVQPPKSAPTSSTAAPIPGEPYNPEEPSIENDEVLKTEKKIPDEGSKSVKEELDNRTQDELVQIAMGNVPLTPIVGQPNPLFPLNGATIAHPHVMSFPDLIQPQPALLPQHQMLGFQQGQGFVAVPTIRTYQGGKNTVLEVRKIPKELNNMVKLSEHFQKFGTITKIQTPFDQDPQGALIEFASNREAYAAYSSPEAILGNRFIKTFWHKPQQQKHGDKDVRSMPVTTTATDGATVDSKQKAEPKKIANANELRYRNPKTDPKLIQMEKKKELEKLEQLKAELRKKKQQSYEDLVEKQKAILQRLQEKGVSAEDKKKLMKTFTTCDAAVKRLKEELQEETKKVKTQALHHVKPYKNTKKEILDKEIDIYHGNLEGEELLEAKKDLEQLKEEVNYDSPRGGRGGYRGRGRGSWYRGRGRGRGGYNMTSVDNRPKKILVAGYTADEKDNVLAHFTAFGHLDQIEEISNDKMIISFPTRKSAELAAIKGTEFNGKQLSLSWFTGQTNKVAVSQGPPNIQRRMTRSLSQSLMEKELEDELLEDIDKDEEDMLLAGVDDDEEDAESIDRSWKR